MDLQNLTFKVKEVAEDVGSYLLDEINKINAVVIESKGKNDYVTYVDKTSEKKIVDRLEKLLPEAGFILEEKTKVKKGDKYNWVIDPLDGTTNYIHGFPCYCISIALLRNNEVVLGLVYDVNSKKCFYAWKNSKAYLNNKEIKTSKTSSINQSLLACSTPSSSFEYYDEYYNMFKEIDLKCDSVRRIGSTALNLCYVACGWFDGYFAIGYKPWDLAAGLLIIEQAGGCVTNFKKGKNVVFTENAIATNGVIHEELSQEIYSCYLSRI